jgi:hypothetical protein
MYNSAQYSEKYPHNFQKHVIAKINMRITTRSRAILILLTIPTALLPGIASISLLSSSGPFANALALHVGTSNVRELPQPTFTELPTQIVTGAMPRIIGLRAGAPYRSPGPILSPMTMATTSSSTVYAYAGFDGLMNFQSCLCAPPDVQVAAGPNHVVEMVNLAGEVFNKTGTSLQIFSLASFFRTGTDFISDPKIMYDSSSGLWFATIIDTDTVPAFTRGAVEIAVSTTSDPTGTWNVYSISSGSQLPDQPIGGISDDKFVVSSNMYTQTAFLGAKWWVVNKNDLVTGQGSPRVTSFGPYSTLESVHPVQSLSSTTTQYMVSTGGSDLSINSTTMKLFAIIGVPGVSSVTNTTTTFSVAVITKPPSGAEPSLNYVDTVDQRVQTGAWFNGNLWLGFNDACTPTGDTAKHSCARLTEINTGTTPSITQDFDYGALGKDYFFPALRIDNSGNLHIVYGFSSSSIHPSLAVTGQAATDPAGSLAPSVTIKSGNADDYFGRYGDYFGAGLDPSDTGVVWVAGEYHNTATGSCDAFGESCWSTFIDRMSFSDYSLTASPTSVTFNPAGTARANVTATSINGFTGTISLLATSLPGAPSVSCSPASLTLGSSASSTCTITGSNPGAFAVTIAGTIGPRSRTATVTANIVGFSITSGFKLLTITGGAAGSVQSRISLIAFGGFSATVTLSTMINPGVSGLTATLNPTSGSVPYGSTLTLNTTASTPTSLNMVNVTGTGGGQTHSVFIAIAITPASTSLNNTATFTGVKVTVTGTLTVGTTGSLTLSGSPTVVAKNSTTSATLFTRTYTIIGLPLSNTTSGSFTTKFLLPIYVNPYALSSSIAVTFSGASATASYALSRDRDINNDGIVNLADLNIAAASMDCTIGQACYNPKADIDASGKIDVSDLASIAIVYLAPSYIADFTISASPISISFKFQSTPPTVTITLTSINGFAGSINLVASVYRGSTLAQYPGLNTTLNPISVTVSTGGTAQSTLSFNQQVCPVTWTVWVTGTSGSISHSTKISVRDYSCPL